MAINRDKILQEAQKLVEKRRYDKAIVEYTKLIVDDPQDVRTLLKIGDLHLKLEQYADAISVYERVGQHYATQGFLVKAVAVYKQIREIIQKHVPHLEDRFGHIVPRLAELLTDLGLISDALLYYDEMAVRYQRVGRERDAIDIFKKIVTVETQNPLSHLRLAEAYVRVRDFDSAVEEYAIAADLLREAGRLDDAVKVLERVLAQRPEGQYARLAAEVYLARGQPNDGMAALTKLQIAFKEDPRDLDTLGLLAKAFEMLGQPQKAIEVKKEAARIAREGGKLDAFEALVRELAARAPNDEGVRALLEMGPKSQPPESASIDIPLEDEPISESIEMVDDSEFEEVGQDEEEAPFPLRSSNPPPLAPGYEPDTPQQRAKELLLDVETLRKKQQFQEAVLMLQTAVSAMPAQRELRERLCDLLIESGDQDQAIVEMLGFAAYLAQSGDGDGAARLLDEVLLLDPSNSPALSMLNALGYAVQPPQEHVEYDERSSDYDRSSDYGRGSDAYGRSSYPYEVPPPNPDTYGQAPNASGHYPAGQIEVPDTGATGEGALPAYDLDDPPALSIREAPASFQIPGEATQFDPSPQYFPEPRYDAQPEGSLPSYPIDEPTHSGIEPLDLPPASRGVSATQLDEAALEEIEFFQAHNMLEEAQNLLAEQLSRLPNHPLLLDKQRELEEALGIGPQGVATAPPSSQVDRSFDIATALGSLDAFDAPILSREPQQVSVETVFEQFKKGVASQIAESDAATHYDLGVAYKEMGLFSDAIAEFELASREPSRECVCQSMIGMMYLEQGNTDSAIDAFIRGSMSSQKTTDQELALTYEIGNAYELRDREQALYYFQLVARIDPNYRDPRGSVEERIDNLEASAKPQPSRAAVGAPDEFDAAFDEMFGDKKK